MDAVLARQLTSPCSRALVFAIVFLALIVAPAAEAAKKPKRPKPCPAASRAYPSSLQARVYQVGVEPDYALVGCDLKTRRRTRIASWYSCGCSIADDSPPRVSLSYRFVVVEGVSCSPIAIPAHCTATMTVVDLRSGRVIHRNDTGSIGPPLIKRNGSLAYLNGEGVVRVDRSGVSVVDPGPGIEQGSLATDGKHLYWLRDGEPQAATFD